VIPLTRSWKGIGLGCIEWISSLAFPIFNIIQVIIENIYLVRLLNPSMFDLEKEKKERWKVETTVRKG
jgi:hypothetical protein